MRAPDGRPPAPVSGGFTLASALNDAQAASVGRVRVVIIGGDGPEPTLFLAGRDGSRTRLAGPLRSAAAGADVVVWTRTVGGRTAADRDLARVRDLGLPAFGGLGAVGLCTLLRCLPVYLADVAELATAAPGARLVVVGDQAGALAQAAAGPLDGRVIGVGSGSALVARTRAALGSPDAGRSRDATCAEIDYLGIDRIGWLRSLRIDGREQLTALLTDRDRLARLADARSFPPGALAAMGAVATADVHRSVAWRDLPDGAGTSAGGPASGPVRDGGAAVTALVEDRGAVVTGLLGALRGEPGRFVLHVVNGGTVAALPPRLVLELACRVDRSGVHPESTHAPGLGQLGLLAAVRDAELLAVAAVRAGSRSQAERALAASPLVASVAAAQAVVGRLLDDEPELRTALSRS